MPGVLTTPDTLQAGEHAAWLDVLKGHHHPLHHGYYVTKQPNIKELAEKLPHEEAHSNETMFFASTIPWNSLTDANLRGCMGVPNLMRELSRLLSRLIEKTWVIHLVLLHCSVLSLGCPSSVCNRKFQ